MAEQFDRWGQMAGGESCPLCELSGDASPMFVQQLSVSALYLNANQAYRGHCQLIFTKRHVRGIEELDETEYNSCMADLRVAAKAIETACKPDHLNYASLGNVVPHLHWHIIPRYVDDPRWGKGIWLTDDVEMSVVELTDSECNKLVEAIRASL